MADTSRQEIKLFYCYAREDKSLCGELDKHLSWLKQHYRLTTWHDSKLLPGEEWEQAIDINLNNANLILLLISPDFMASEYCNKEMQRALELNRTGACRVVSILLRPCYWQGAPFSKLQLLPTDARPVSRWPDQDEAFQDVVSEISRVIKDLLIPAKTSEDWYKEGVALNDLKRHEEALKALEQAIRLDPNYADPYNGKGAALSNLKRYEEALAVCNQAIRLNPNNADYYSNKGIALSDLKRYEEAITAYDQAIHFNPNNADYYNIKGDILIYLKRYEEAEQTYEKARQIAWRSQ